MTVEKKIRLPFVDVMKGVGIIFIILLHCGVAESSIKFTQSFNITLFFFISGFFFDVSRGLKSFIIGKFNTLIIPYFFFSSLMLIPHLIFKSRDLDILSVKYFLFFYLEPFNNPLWFLRCLFLGSLFYYMCLKYISKDIIRLIVCFFVSIVVYFFTRYFKNDFLIFEYWFFVKMNLLTSLFSLPFLCVGHVCFKKWKSKIIQSRWNMLGGIVFVLIYLLTLQDKIGLWGANFGNNIFLFYINSFSAIFAIFLLSILVGDILYISFIGRYSLIVLGTHAILIELIKGVFPNISLWLLLFLILFISPFVIFVLKKYFPLLTAQKNCCDY